jgi:subtilisin
VFPFNRKASTFDIMKAIDRAKQDGCDLVNMSLSQSFFDEGIVSSIKDAHEAGMLCFAANGNDDRNPVSFPASYSLCISVSAMGRQGLFLKQAFQALVWQSPSVRTGKISLPVFPISVSKQI